MERQKNKIKSYFRMIMSQLKNGTLEFFCRCSFHNSRNVAFFSDEMPGTTPEHSIECFFFKSFSQINKQEDHSSEWCIPFQYLRFFLVSKSVPQFSQLFSNSLFSVKSENIFSTKSEKSKP